MRQRVAAILVAILAICGLVTSPAGASAPTTSWTAECPVTIRCVVVPAAYSANNGDVTDYGNYDLANRPSMMTIDSIVIHDTEGSMASAIAEFQDPTKYLSVQYIVDKDGTVYQMVPDRDMAWHSGNWWYNMHSVGIEHVGYAADSASFTPAMYWSSAQLVKYLTARYNIPRDRGHILGHDNVPGTSARSIASQHVDPGPFWNWQLYMALIGAPVLPHGNFASGMVTVAPIWPLSQQSVTGCSEGGSSCVPPGVQSTNFVYLHTSPSLSAPLVSDPVLGQGSTDITNNAARLFYGQTFATVKPPQIDGGGMWWQVWANGVTGWFYSPWSAPTAMPAMGQAITPKAGLTSISVYGRPIPERSEYPVDLIAVPPASWYIPTQTPLPYPIGAGQRYVVISTDVPTDHYYAWASDSSFPYDHTDFTGATKYIEISLGNRTGFVKADDVTIQ